jgi:hypothetical protein
VLVDSQWGASDWLSSVLDHHDLHDDSHDHDEQEEAVVEESLEHIVLVSTKLSGVDFVEDLHENESVEYHCVVIALGSGTALDSFFA